MTHHAKTTPRMTPVRPYLLRAFYEWIVHNHLTPYILVSAELPGVLVPKEYVQEGRIIFNISPDAVKQLQITNQLVEFDASFSGSPFEVSVPINAVFAIYAQENGHGMAFSDSEEMTGGENTTLSPPPPPPRAHRSRKPKLTIIK